MSLRPLLLAALTSILAACGAAPEADEPATPAPSSPVAARAHALVSLDGGAHLVLRPSLDPALALDEIESRVEGDVIVARRSVDPSALSSDELAWEGRSVRLYGPHGALCEGTVEAVEALGLTHSSMVNGPYGDGDEERLSDEQLKQQAWQHAIEQGKVDLSARVRVRQGDCEGAVWAQPTDERAPAFASAEPAGDELRAAALSLVRSTADYQEQQESYEQRRSELSDDERGDRELPARWEDYNSFNEIQRIALPDGDSLVLTALNAGEGCGDLGGSMLTLFRLHDGKLTAVDAPALSLNNLPLGAADLDGDGHADLLVSDGFVRWDEGAYRTHVSNTLPEAHGCGC